MEAAVPMQENPYQPPTQPLQYTRQVAVALPKRRPFQLSIMLATLCPAIFLVDEQLHPAIVCACLIAPPLHGFFTQSGRWRLYAMVICVCYTIFFGLLGAFAIGLVTSLLGIT
jgi:hypothetical protein